MQFTEVLKKALPDKLTEAIPVVMPVGRYMTHAVAVNSLQLNPPASHLRRGRMNQPLWISEAEVVQRLSKEFITRYAGEGWQRVMPLSQLLARREKHRGEADVTLFKAMGMGISDLALGAEIYGRALQQGAGHEFPQPQRAKPRFVPGKVDAAV